MKDHLLSHRNAFVATHRSVHAPAPADPARLAIGLGAWIDTAKAHSDHAVGQAMIEATNLPEARRWLEAIFGNSPFLTGLALRDPEIVLAVMARGPDATFAELLARLNLQHAGRGNGAAKNLADLGVYLRRARRHAAIINGLADLAGIWALEQVTAALSQFADSVLSVAIGHLLWALHRDKQIVLPKPNEPERDSGLIVLGMGKLGAFELNYSSDIDLIILFDADKIVCPDRDRLQQSMTRLTRDLVKLLEERTVEGYVFRIDLRLRPDPSSTPPAVSVEAAEVYYGSVGQNWERAAMIKARPVAGDLVAGRAFLNSLIPFLWRKHLDFAAIQDILSIKRQIDSRYGGSVARIAGHNIKLGHGGIREIEFLAQTQQLIWGGRLPELRTLSTVDTLRGLVSIQRLDGAIAEDLIAAYRFLRQVEHRLQMVEDHQTHSLPSKPEEMENFAIFMGYASRAEFEDALRAQLTIVQQHFHGLFDRSPSLASGGNLVFTGKDDDPETLETLTRFGFKQPDRAAGFVRGWHHGRIRATRSQRARELLTELVPHLLRLAGETRDPDLALSRFDEFLSGIPAGVQLLSLFRARPDLLGLVMEIMGEAPGLARRLARKPALLDFVLTGDFFAQLEPTPDMDAFRADLDAALSRARDFEDVLDIVRRWAGDRKFQVGVHLLQARTDGEVSGRHLTAIAETAIRALLPHVIAQMEAAHGKVTGGGFAVLGLGKLGSREMTALSDLDLTFVYEAKAGVEMSRGGKALSVPAYFARLGQRLLSALTALTAEGSLYEVDMRLRPSGSSGPIASNLDAFSRYYAEQAWTWERMVLTRARVVAGSPALTGKLETAVRAVLTRPVPPNKLLADVADMRQRMLRQHAKPAAWDCKHRRGGLIDIEFLAQYLQLSYGPEHPELLNVETEAALDGIAAAGFLDPASSGALIAGLRLWHQLQGTLRVLVDEKEEAALTLEAFDTILTKATGIEDVERAHRHISRVAIAVLDCYQRLIETPAAAVSDVAASSSPNFSLPQARTESL